jgi:catechol 2,3-dioxygenase-like lactoylglutathione lyase family enzyme
VAVQLNHTIVHARDSRASATFVADLLGLPAPTHAMIFEVVEAANGVSLDFMDTEGEITPQHYAFLVGDAEFDEIFGRITSRGIAHWADPDQSQEGQINTRWGGRGVYFEDPDGHLLEILTRPYGTGA